jgi:hypothetical protein
MQPHRLSVKFFVAEPAAVELSRFVPIFQRWIQRQWVEGLLIDVANYDHVPNGPGVILIGDEGDYALDMGDGRPGLLYTRKRQIDPTPSEYLATTFRLALIAAQKLAQEPTLKGIQFNYAEAQITYLDRLNAPNTPEAFAQVKNAVEAFASSLYAGSAIHLQQAYQDRREPLSILVRAEQTVSAENLLERLTASVPASQ